MKPKDTSSSSEGRPRTAPELPKLPDEMTGADSTCPSCGGVGFRILDVPVGHPDFGKAVPCACKEEERVWRRLESYRSVSHINDFAHFSFENFDPKREGLSLPQQRELATVWKQCRAYVAEPKGWLLLTGSYGTGKTHLAAAIANGRLEAGHPAVFIVLPDLLDYLRSTFNPASNVSYDTVFEEVRSARMLILDDFGTQNGTPWVQEKLYQLLNHRYVARYPTVITTNQRLTEIDQRLRSRFEDTHLVTRFDLQFPDYRAGMSASYIDLSTLRDHSQKRFDTFDERLAYLDRKGIENLTRVKQAARHYAENPLGWFVLLGVHGSGKTHLAAAIANEWLYDGFPEVMFVSVPDLLDFLRATFSPDSPVTYDRRFDEVKRIPRLVLDNLGMESASPWAREKLFQLLEFRYNKGLPTVITTSSPPEKLDPWFESRIADPHRCQTWLLNVSGYRGSRDQTERKGRGSYRS